MPRGFSDEEKTRIRARLLEKGRGLFEQYGLKKTNVEDLTRAAGISKGAFYHFYESKEELFFEILDRVEEEFQQKVFTAAVDKTVPVREGVIRFMRTVFEQLAHYPLLYSVGKDEYESLMRKLPREKAEAHVRGDALALEQVMSRFRQTGRLREIDPQLLANLGVSLYLLWMHRNDMVFSRFEETLDAWIRMLADYLVLEEELPPVARPE